MLKIKSYVKVNSLAEAYELNQKKTARILGGMDENGQQSNIHSD